MKGVDIVSGIATGVRYTVEVSGNRDGVSTTHRTIFRVGAVTVSYSSPAPGLISDGDRVVLAGSLKDGRLLQADAYVNRTAGIRGDAGRWLSFAAMLFFLPLGCAGLTFLALCQVVPGMPELEGWALVFAAAAAAIPCAAGLYFAGRWRRISAAVNVLLAEEKGGGRRSLPERRPGPPRLT